MDRSSHHPLGTVESNMLQGSFAPHSFAPMRATQKLRTWKILPFSSMKFQHFVEQLTKKTAKINDSSMNNELSLAWTASLLGFCTLHVRWSRKVFFWGRQHETADVMAVLVYCLNIQRRYCKPVVLHIRKYPCLDTSDCITFRISTSSQVAFLLLFHTGIESYPLKYFPWWNQPKARRETQISRNDTIFRKFLYYLGLKEKRRKTNAAKQLFKLLEIWCFQIDTASTTQGTCWIRMRWWKIAKQHHWYAKFEIFSEVWPPQPVKIPASLMDSSHFSWPSMSTKILKSCAGRTSLTLNSPKVIGTWRNNNGPTVVPSKQVVVGILCKGITFQLIPTHPNSGWLVP